MYDGNEDERLDILDLTNFKQEIPEGSKLYAEITKLIDEDMNMNVYRVHGTTRRDITEGVFTDIIGNSVLNLEFYNKLTGEKGEEYVMVPGQMIQKPLTKVQKINNNNAKRRKIKVAFKEPLSQIEVFFHFFLTKIRKPKLKMIF